MATTAQSLLLLLPILLSLSYSAFAATAPVEIAALAAFKSGITPASILPWSCLATWNFSYDPCLTPRRTHFLCGLQCTGNRVTAITLDPAGYSGTVTPLLSNLRQLTYLDLSGNSFYGPIPASLSFLSLLQTLNLASNSFSGGLPAVLSGLASLESLDLSHNELTGPIPGSLTSLIILRRLDLSYNRLTGWLPKLPPNLVELALRGNLLSGSLQKPVFEALLYLEVAELGSNAFTGKVEGWFFQLPSLQQVDLANNSLRQVEVWKSWQGEESQLVAVDLGYNKIEGYLPVELAGYQTLSAVSMRHNRLRGGIPWEYCWGKKGSPFRRLFLDGNFLKGKVPAGFFEGGGAEDDGRLSGSFGDNCLESCPVSSPVCQPLQKPVDVCKQVYGMGTRRPHATSSLTTTTSTINL